jgi:hypothetical protein
MRLLTETVQKAPMRCTVGVKVFAFKVLCVDKESSVLGGLFRVFHPGFVLPKYFRVIRKPRLVINMPLAHKATNPLLHIERYFNSVEENICVARTLLDSQRICTLVAYVMVICLLQSR